MCAENSSTTQASTSLPGSLAKQLGSLAREGDIGKATGKKVQASGCDFCQYKPLDATSIRYEGKVKILYVIQASRPIWNELSSI